jgi:hypothetical protein
MSFASRIPLPLLALTACSPASGGQVGEETLGCLPVDSIALGETDPSPLGFTIMDVEDFTVGQHETELRWEGGSTTPLTIGITYSGNGFYRDREWVDEGGSAEPALLDDEDCPDILDLEIAIEVSTDDGALNESWMTSLAAVTAMSASASHEFPAVSGTLDLAAFAPSSDYDELRGFLELRIEGQAVSGTLTGQVSKSGGGGDSDTASAETFPIAEFGAASSN